MNTPRVLRVVKVDGIWQRLPVAKTPKGYDWGSVTYKGEKIPVADGTFYLEYRDQGVKVRRPVGKTVREVKAAMATQHTVLELRAKGVEVDDAPEIRNRERLEGPKIRKVVEEYVKAPPIHLRERSAAKVKEALLAYAAWTKKTHLCQVDRREVLDFLADLHRQKGLSMSTAVGKCIVLTKAMRDAGAVIEMRRGDWPKVTVRQPEMYTPEQLKPLFAAMTRAEFVLYQTFLLTGFRDQEVGYLAWTDFDPKRGMLSVTKKSGYNFDPKNYKERTVPIPPALVTLLKRHKELQEEGEYFIFPTRRWNKQRGMDGGQRDTHMLLKLKKIALRAGLNCGRCHSTYNNKPASCYDKPMCGLWGLHKFRHTYATTLLRLGFDILSVQKLMGHDDIESTMKYLRALQQEDMGKKMNESAIATMFV